MSAVPELKMPVIQRMEVCGVVDEDGMHVKFGMAIVPIIVELALADDPVTEKIAVFMETMANCADIKVQELLDFTILEGIIDNKSALSAMKKHMRKRTLAHCAEVERFMM